jgi:hypothetical protein
MPDKKCSGNAERQKRLIASYSDYDILDGLSHHQDHAWWKEERISRLNQAYLKRWGSYLRREARRRGLL